MTSTNERRVRIAFDNLCTHKWIAGCHYLKNLSVALGNTAENPSLILCGEAADDSANILEQYVEQCLISPTQVNKWLNLAFRLERRFSIPLGMGQLMATFLRRHGIDILFTSVDQGQWFNLPLLAWLTDFQHIHLPEMFSRKEIIYRDRTYLRTAKHADCVILSSTNALLDFQNFAPAFANKGRVLHFVAYIPVSIYDASPIWVCGKYRLPERFFYVPNQFWKHKNHFLLLEALDRLKKLNVDATIVCSGNINDSRNPDYFPQLQSAISRLGLEDRFIILGIIPHEHTFHLMRQSMAVLQPSLFEGWSTSVEETKSIGKRIILSDLAVHREQNPPSALYFEPHDTESLAQCLAETLEQTAPGPDRQLEYYAREHLPDRIKGFGAEFMKIVWEVIGPGTANSIEAA